jgi:hypothetical protein
MCVQEGTLICEQVSEYHSLTIHYGMSHSLIHTMFEGTMAARNQVHFSPIFVVLCFQTGSTHHRQEKTQSVHVTVESS